MPPSIDQFESFARRAIQLSDIPPTAAPLHPFEERGIHQELPADVRELFDNGHYAQSTFEAFKFVDHEVRRHSRLSESGTKLMMQAFGGDQPPISLTPRQTPSEQDEQEGYKFLFAGAMLGIRNPRGHEFDVRDAPEECLDHLALASALMRRLAAAGYTSASPTSARPIEVARPHTRPARAPRTLPR